MEWLVGSAAFSAGIAFGGAVIAVLVWRARRTRPAAGFHRRSSDVVAPDTGSRPDSPGSVSRRGSARDRFLPTRDWATLLVADDTGLPTLFLQQHAGELWLTEPTTGSFVSVGNERLRELGIWTIWLRNVDSRTIVAREGLLQPGSTVTLVREPGSEHPASIAVHAATGRPVGQVSPRIAAGLAALLDGGATLRAVVVSFNPQVGADQPGLTKVLAGTPEVIGHLLRTLPGIAPIGDRNAVPAR